MAAVPDVRATVFDISRCHPQRGDFYWVDTNVWYWLTYTRASQSESPPRPYQVRTYPAFVNLAQRQGASLRYCGLSFAELAHRIEQVEHWIFQRSSGKEIPVKEFRHNHAAERANVLAEIETAWAIVEGMAASIPATIDKETTAGCLSQIKNHCLDGYDAFYAGAIKQSGYDQILTDDADFVTVPDVRIYTANRTAIDAARSVGRLAT